jgi:hypothetical protein
VRSIARSTTIRSLGEIFTDYDPPALLTVSQRLTSWTDGRLNLRRADAACIDAALRHAMPSGDIERIITLRNADPDLSAIEILRAANLSTQQQRQAAAVVVDGSTCFSLWIVTDQRDRRTGYDLFVRPPREGPLQADWRFSW